MATAMEVYSIWYLLLIFLTLLIPAVLVGYARGGLTRPGFASRFAGSLALYAVAYWVAAVGHEAALLVIFVLTLLIFRWTAMRLNDVGLSRWWALLWYLWPVALFLAVALCFIRTGAAKPPARFRPASPRSPNPN